MDINTVLPCKGVLDYMEICSNIRIYQGILCREILANAIFCQFLRCFLNLSP